MTGQVLVIDGAGTLYELENASAPDTQHRFTNSWVLDARYASVFFFFSSRRRHTRFDCDWSSDVCSSDLLLGPSGCGKTTLLRMIAGLERPTSGEIFIGGERVAADVPPRARGIAMVFQSYALYPHRTVAQNIAFPLEASGMPRPQIAEKVRWAAEMFGIARYLERYPRQLSGGERQRVALCRALVRDPKVFLLDEPLANLDAKLRNTARDELKRVQRRIQRTTVYVTHDQVEAMGLGDRIAVMDHGKLRQIGTPQEVYEDPVDTFVATFVGQPPMNLVEVRDPALSPARPRRARARA